MSSLELEALPTVRSDAGSVPARGLCQTDPEQVLGEFLAHRAALLGIAARIVRDAGLAEDCVQEAWLRWQFTDHTDIVNPRAFLATTVTRLAINLIQTASHRREAASDSVSDHLVDRSQDPADRVGQTAAIEETLGMLMSRLSRAQLAAYLLRKAFDYPYPDIAHVLRTSIPNARQLIRRAQVRIADGSERPVGGRAQLLVAAAFFAAARGGDLNGLLRLLAPGDGPTPPRSPAPSEDFASMDA